MSQVMLEDNNSELTQLAQKASSGEEIILVRGTVPIAKVVPMPTEKPQEPRKSGFGSAKDKLIYMADDFDAPLEDFKNYM